MSAEHKAALAEGRTQGGAVRAYLEALEANRPKRGRKRTPDSINKRLATIDTELQISRQAPCASPPPRTSGSARRAGRSMDNTVDLAGVEKDFVAAAKDYGERKGISYATWREAGVSPAVLKQAGISRCRVDGRAGRRQQRTQQHEDRRPSPTSHCSPARGGASSRRRCGPRCRFRRCRPPRHLGCRRSAARPGPRLAARPASVRTGVVPLEVIDRYPQDRAAALLAVSDRRVVSTRTSTVVHKNLRPRFFCSAPGSRPASVRT